MNTLDELRRWRAEAPAGATVPAYVVASMLDGADLEPDRPAGPVVAPQEGVQVAPWRVLLWTCAPEVRIGRAELLEAVARPASWLYRRTGEKARDRIPHRKLEGELVFIVGEVRRWLRDSEEIVEVGPVDERSLTVA